MSVRGLKVEFKTPFGVVRALDGVDMDIRRGAVVGVVGESGCGKSVTARSIIRLIRPPGEIVGGSIRFYPRVMDRNRSSDQGDGGAASAAAATGVAADGSLDITRMDPEGPGMRALRGADIALISQEPMSSLNPVFTIGAQIEEAILLHQTSVRRSARERAVHVLEQVGMPSPQRIANCYPHELSGGMRQRAVIAMALSCRPDLLMADEPTTALDVTTQAQIIALLRDLQGESGMSILFITHSLGVVAQICDEVIVMYLGQVVERAPVAEIFHAPKHPYTRALLESMPRMRTDKRRRLHEIQGSIPDPFSRIPGCPFHPRCADAIAGVCDRIEPAERVLANGVGVRCHLYSESGPVVAAAGRTVTGNE